MSNFVDNIQQCLAAFPAMFEFVLKVKVMGSNPGYLLKSFLLYHFFNEFEQKLSMMKW